MRRGEYSDLIVWQKSMDLVDSIYEITKSFPRDEVFGLISQLRRASTSIAMNIWEWNWRKTDKDFAHFLSIAYSSCIEVEIALKIANRQKYIHHADLKEIVLNIREIMRMISGLSHSLFR